MTLVKCCVHTLIAAGRTKRHAARWAEPPRRSAPHHLAPVHCSCQSSGGYFNRRLFPLVFQCQWQWPGSAVAVPVPWQCRGSAVASCKCKWQCRGSRYDFKSKTTYQKNPQLTTTYRQKAPIAQYVRRIDAQIAVRFCAICLINIMPKALGDILTVSILIGGCVFFIRQAGVCRHLTIFWV